MTVEEFLACSVPEGKAELVRGELRVTPPPGAPHGTAATNLVVMLDLAIEVLSPSETASELEEKLDDYLVSGHRSSGSWTRFVEPS